jgi:predicted O-methyltransferase YrrM
MTKGPLRPKHFSQQDDEMGQSAAFATDLATDADIARWYHDKDFSCDWTTGNIPVWAGILADHRARPVRVLEIGSWEGRSALFFLNYLPQCRLTCIDTFGGNVEHHEDEWFAKLVPGVEARFDANLAPFRERVEKIKGPSGEVVPQLAVAGRRFDVAYIDGSHYAADVYADAALTWPLMETGGIVIFDDYEWGLMNEESERPKLGIDAFLAAIPGQHRVIHRDYQMIVARL